MKNYWWIVIIVVLGIILYSRQTPISLPDTETPIWLEEYSKTLTPGMSHYLRETSLYDYSSPEIQEIVNKIKLESKSVEDAVKLTLDYVYFNVNYNWGESDSVCYSSSASTILTKKSGQCDTMSRVNIAILRGLGIAARPEGGCLAFDQSCIQTYSILGLRKPVIQKIVETNGIASRQGGLHAWLEVYIPSKGGWVDAESTSGTLIDEDDCLLFVHELYPVNVIEECVSTDISFINMCKKL